VPPPHADYKAVDAVIKIALFDPVPAKFALCGGVVRGAGIEPARGYPNVKVMLLILKRLRHLVTHDSKKASGYVNYVSRFQEDIFG
jgi:hypothetical protein